MEILKHIPWRQFDFPRHDMTKFVFDTMSAFGNKDNWHVNYHDWGIQSNLLMFFKDNNVHGYRSDFVEYSFGDVVFEFAMHQKDYYTAERHSAVTARYVVHVEYENFKCMSITFLIDGTVIEQYRR